MHKLMIEVQVFMKAHVGCSHSRVSGTKRPIADRSDTASAHLHVMTIFPRRNKTEEHGGFLLAAPWVGYLYGPDAAD